MSETITLSAGGGGKAMNKLLSGIILKHFTHPELSQMRDASYLTLPQNCAFSTDSFIITPEFFPGGDIGKLAVAGTTNDLACSGATPLYLSCGLIIPEGFSYKDLDAIIESMANAAKEAGVDIITGDTKVVPRGELKGLMINTSGIGEVKHRWNDYNNIKIGDRLIITSDIARHGVAVFLAREELGFTGRIKSDCNILCKMLKFDNIDGTKIRFMRDATRGGVAAVLNEIFDFTGYGISIEEDKIPIQEDVLHFCETLGFDPLAVANEGAVVMVVDDAIVEDVLFELHKHSAGERAAVCGVVTEDKGVILETSIGGKRYVETPLGEILPRIC